MTDLSRERAPDHVAFMLRGVAVKVWEALKHNEKILQHARHEKAQSRTGLF
jgi:hypothetical protein